MLKTRYWHWWPVAVGTLATVALLAFAFGPSHKRAVANSAAALRAAADLQAKVATLKQVPQRQQQLDSLVRMLGSFRAGLHATDKVGEAMRAFEERAEAAGLECRTLNPSVPTLVTLDRSRDSIEALNLALLPVEFECTGEYVALGRFLAAEERRPQFCQWERLTITSSSVKDHVRARAEVQFFLLPAESPNGGAS